MSKASSIFLLSLTALYSCGILISKNIVDEKKLYAAVNTQQVVISRETEQPQFTPTSTTTPTTTPTPTPKPTQNKVTKPTKNSIQLELADIKSLDEKTFEEYKLYTIDPFNNRVIFSNGKHYAYIWSERGKTWISINIFPDIIALYDPNFARVEKKSLTYKLSMYDIRVYADSQVLSVYGSGRLEFTISDETTKNLLQNASLYNLLNNEKILDNKSVESRMFGFFISTLTQEFLYNEKNPQDMTYLADYVKNHQNFLKDKQILKISGVESINEPLDVELEIDGKKYYFKKVPFGNIIQGLGYLYFVSDSLRESTQLAKTLPTIYIPNIKEILKQPKNTLERSFVDEFYAYSNNIKQECGIDARQLDRLITVYERDKTSDERKCAIDTIGIILSDFLEDTSLTSLGKPYCINKECLSYLKIK
ncbi:MAG: hypothetical protein N3D75_04710 [Candidatus Aenigmarchaeota archaeon]|nr:hypothetical protein [Candidatus Aenigmarchaeota archaeon]